MEKSLRIGGKDVQMVANAATPRVYRSCFKKDLFIGMQHAINEDNEVTDFEVFENLAYVMAVQGGLKESVDDWLAGFDSPTAVIEAIPEIIGLWADNTTATSNGKKK